jgi:hypothetical protein
MDMEHLAILEYLGPLEDTDMDMKVITIFY